MSAGRRQAHGQALGGAGLGPHQVLALPLAVNHLSVRYKSYNLISSCYLLQDLGQPLQKLEEAAGRGVEEAGQEVEAAGRGVEAAGQGVESARLPGNRRSPGAGTDISREKKLNLCLISNLFCFFLSRKMMAQEEYWKSWRRSWKMVNHSSGERTTFPRAAGTFQMMYMVHLCLRGAFMNSFMSVWSTKEMNDDFDRENIVRTTVWTSSWKCCEYLLQVRELVLYLMFLAIITLMLFSGTSKVAPSTFSGNRK